MSDCNSGRHLLFDNGRFDVFFNYSASPCFTATIPPKLRARPASDLAIGETPLGRTWCNLREIERDRKQAEQSRTEHKTHAGVQQGAAPEFISSQLMMHAQSAQSACFLTAAPRAAPRSEGSCLEGFTAHADLFASEKEEEVGCSDVRQGWG